VNTIKRKPAAPVKGNEKKATGPVKGTAESMRRMGNMLQQRVERRSGRGR
jgi:hypothetical protein